MTTIQSNTYTPQFTGLKYNNTIKMAREYANNTGQKEKFKDYRKLINKVSGDSLTINIRKNKNPEECFHVSILNKGLFNKFIGGVDYLYPSNKSIGEYAFEIIKNLADKKSEIYKTVFNK